MTLLDALNSPLTRGIDRADPAPGSRVAPPPGHKPRADVPLRLPLARGQEAIWQRVRNQPWSALYNVLVATARFTSPLDATRVRALYQTLLDRHAALRAVFREEGGLPVQEILAHPGLDFHEVVCAGGGAGDSQAELTRRVEESYRQPFALETGPLFRVRLFRCAADSVLLVTAHQLVLDGPSVGRLTEETLRLLSDPEASLATPALSYANYIAWQRDWMAGPEAARSLSYWQSRLAEPLPILDLPLDWPRRQRSDHVGATQPFSIDSPLLESLRQLARQRQTSLSNLLLAAFQVLLFRHAGQSDIITGMPVAARPRPEFHEVVGLFANQVAIRGDLSGNPGFVDFLSQIDTLVGGAQVHQNLDFADLVEQLGVRPAAGYTPVFQATFVFHGVRLLGEQSGFFGFGGERGALEIAGLRAEVYPLMQPEGQFDLSLELVEGAREVTGRFDYNPDLFLASRMARLAGHYAVLLAGIVADPTAPVARLPLLGDLERRQLIAWNATATPLPVDMTIHRVVENRSALQPDATALVHEGQRIGYGDMNARANRLAHYLLKLDFPVGTPIGVCLPPSPERIVALLAILKSGCAYLPLDPDYPAERLELMVEDARCAAILCLAETRESLRGTRACLLGLEVVGESLAVQPTHNPQRSATGSATAYVIFTSGSTGRPKGVPISHVALCNLAREQIRAFRVDPDSRVLQYAAFSFDASVAEIFTALCAGASLHLQARPALLPGPALWDTLRELRISHLTLPPSALSVLPRQPLPDLLHLVVAGETCPGDLAAHWQKGRHFYNAYGPTEAAVCTTLMECTRILDGKRGPPIGRPLANTRVYLLGPDLQPVPIGVRGELFISGVGLTAGYLQGSREDSPFLDSPFEPGQRLYRSGDLARWLEDGTIEFLGRRDQQVKVCGYRVEPGEIEMVLRADPDVADAVVLADAGPDGLPRLDAYVVASEPVSDRLAFQHRLRAFLEEQLPAYMVPSGFAVLADFPRNPAGKVDRPALRGHAQEAHRSAAPYVPARDATEQALTDLWAHLLGVAPPGVHDDFFDLGGHTLLAASLINAIQAQFGKTLSVAALLEHATIAKLARLLEGYDETETRSPLLVSLQGRGQETPLYLVHALAGDVFAYRELAHSLGSDQPVYALRAPGLIEGEALLSSVIDLAGHHVRALRRQQPYGPYRLAGWSLGGVIAYEMARCLRRAGEKVERLILIDSHPPELLRELIPGNPAMILAQELGGLFGDQLLIDPASLPGDPVAAAGNVLRQAVSLGLLPGSGLDVERMARLFLANLAAMLGHKPAPFRGKLTLLRATEGLSDHPDNGWGEVCGHPVEVRPAAGDHYSLLRQPHVRHLATALRDCFRPGGRFPGRT